LGVRTKEGERTGKEGEKLDRSERGKGNSSCWRTRGGVKKGCRGALTKNKGMWEAHIAICLPGGREKLTSMRRREKITWQEEKENLFMLFPNLQSHKFVNYGAV